jgi:hypothetical protein
MKRSVRRHRQRVAKARRVRILLRHGAWTPSSYWQPKIWQPLCRLVMSEPGWWVHERLIPRRKWLAADVLTDQPGLLHTPVAVIRPGRVQRRARTIVPDLDSGNGLRREPGWYWLPREHLFARPSSHFLNSSSLPAAGCVSRLIDMLQRD